MKKISAIMVMAMFLLSLVPVVLAEEGSDSDRTETDTRLKTLNSEFRERMIAREKGTDVKVESKVDGREIAKLRANAMSRLAERLDNHEKRLVELRKDEHFQKFDRAQKAREVTKVRIENARQKAKEASEEYDQAVGEYRKVHEKASKLKDVLRECEESETDECKSKLRDHKGETKRFLLHTADVILAQIEKIEARINQNEDLSEEEASELLARLAESAKKIREARATIESLTEESSKEEIKEAAQTIRDAWKDIKPKLQKNVDRVVNSRIGGIIVRSKHLETKLIKTLERMEKAGKDTSAVESLVESFNSHLDDAAEAYKQSLEALKNDKPREAHDLRIKAHESLKKAHEVLKEIHRAIKNSGEKVSDEPADKESDESEDESDEAEEADENESEESEDDEDESEDETEDSDEESDESDEKSEETA